MKKRVYWKSKHDYLYGIMLALVALCFAGCKDDNEQEGAAFDPSRPIVITDFTPKQAGYGGKLIVYGENFGNDASKIKVTVGGKTAKVINVKGQSLYCVVPEKAYDGDIQISALDNGGEIIASAKSEKNLEYVKKWLVSTYIGKHYEIATDFKEKEGPFDDCGGFEDAAWFTFDPKSNFDKLYLSGDQKKSRLIDFAANDGKGYVTFFDTPGINRVSALNWTNDENQDMIVSLNKNSDTETGHWIFSRSSGFKEKTGLLKARSTNGTIVHPINGEFYYSGYFDKEIYRYDFNTKERTVAFRTANDRTSVSMVVHPRGNYAYLTIFERAYIARTDYDWDKKSFGNPYLVCGSNNNYGYNDGVGTNARLYHPRQGVFVKNPDYAGQADEYDYYFCDMDNHAIRKLTPQGKVSTFAGRGNNATIGYADGELLTQSRFNSPRAITYDEKRHCFYIGEGGNKVVRKIALEGE